MTTSKSKARGWHREDPEPESTHGNRDQQALRRHETNEEYDTTDCTPGGYEHKVNRDYHAHCMRWGWALRHCPGRRVLDFGCGKDTPMVNTLSVFAGDNPEFYLGCDLNQVKERHRQWAAYLSGVDLCDPATARRIHKEFGTFDAAVSFEVIEHIPFSKQEDYLLNLRSLLERGGDLFLSTPVYYPGRGMAKNHVAELTIPELQRLVTGVGFEVVRRFGTFSDWGTASATRKALKAELGYAGWKALEPVIKRVEEFYDGEVLANWWAPAYPDQARNNMWVLRRKP